MITHNLELFIPGMGREDTEAKRYCLYKQLQYFYVNLQVVHLALPKTQVIAHFYANLQVVASKQVYFMQKKPMSYS